MTSDRPPFDPNSRGAQKLLRDHAQYRRWAEPMTVVLTIPMLQLKGEHGTMLPANHKAGERLTVKRAKGESMIERGLARRA